MPRPRDLSAALLQVPIADAQAGRREGIGGRYEVPLPAAGARVAVKLVDVLGEETLVLLPD